MKYNKRQALVVVDIQKDFLPGGNLAVPNADEIIPYANSLMQQFHHDGKVVVSTQDWHPPDHLSFAENVEGTEPFDEIDRPDLDIDQVWPTHCVEYSEGAEFADDLLTEYCQQNFKKGMNPKVDSYSGFYDNNHEESTGLARYLEGKNVEDVFIIGLAADVCVKFTVFDALKEGFNTALIKDVTKGIGDVDKAAYDMMNEGAEVMTFNDIFGAN